MPIEFHWILPHQLAGSGQPGFMGSLVEDLAWLSDQGVHTIVTLTEQPMKLASEHRGDFRWLHFPIDDMGIPTPRRAAVLVQDIVESVSRSQSVLVHCKAGLGRTGTILACCLVALGSAPGDAITNVRRSCPNYIQRARQERFVHEFARFMSTASINDLRHATSLPEAS